MPDKKEDDKLSDVLDETSKEEEKTTKSPEDQREEYLDGWKRAKADLSNYKKEELQRLEHVVKFANEDIIRDLIGVLDSFDLALTSMEENNPSEKGIYLIKSKLEDILNKKGLSRIEVKKGDKFDPVYHEAVNVVEDESEKSDTIAEELETGYTLHERVIRAAKVKVFK